LKVDRQIFAIDSFSSYIIIIIFISFVLALKTKKEAAGNFEKLFVFGIRNWFQYLRGSIKNFAFYFIKYLWFKTLLSKIIQKY
jgi:hypothetical protein